MGPTDIFVIVAPGIVRRCGCEPWETTPV